ncbi:hypothetical protein ACWD62_40490 [Streptomyces sp. NPDC005146]
MAKAPAVIGVLTEPAPPTWWKRNRHRIALAFGLWAGWQLCANVSGHAASPDQPRPAYTSPATPSADSTVKPLPRPTHAH